MDHPIQLSLELSPVLWQRLGAEAEQQHISVEELLITAAEYYLYDTADDATLSDTPDAVIFADLRQALADMRAGKPTYPIESLFTTFKAETDDHNGADPS